MHERGSERRRLTEAILVRLDPATLLHLQAVADRGRETAAGWIRSRLHRSFFPSDTSFPPSPPPRPRPAKRSVRVQQRSLLIAHLARLTAAVTHLTETIGEHDGNEASTLQDLISELLVIQQRLAGLVPGRKL